MSYAGIDDFTQQGAGLLARGCVALIFVEDAALIAETVDHHLALGFDRVVLLGPAALVDGAAGPAVAFDSHAPGAVPRALGRIAAAAVPGTWIYWGYNAEFLFFPFSESRTIADLLAFHAEERRRAMSACVVDLYAGDLDASPFAVSLDDAWFDADGYYAQPRFRDGRPLEGQVDIYGGLRRRFARFVPWPRQRIDRTAIFRAEKGVQVRDDFTFGDEDMNTLSCPWHRNLTAAVASFRAARALAANPVSGRAIDGFRWEGSRRFEWRADQLMRAGLMEPGQWF